MAKPMTKEEARRVLDALREGDRLGRQMSTHGRQARAELRRSAMPEPEENDFGVGEGGRQKLPVRYD